MDPIAMFNLVENFHLVFISLLLVVYSIFWIETSIVCENLIQRVIIGGVLSNYSITVFIGFISQRRQHVMGAHKHSNENENMKKRTARI